MRGTWLYSALCCCLLCIFDLKIGWWLLPCFVLFLFYRQGKWCLLSLMLLLILQIERIPNSLPLPDLQAPVRIKEIKTNYQIAQTKDQMILLYGLDQVDLDALWSVEGECTQIDGNQNFGLFDFASYMSDRGIYYGCQIKKGKEVKPADTIRGTIWKNIDAREEPISNFLKLMLYGIQEEAMQLDGMATSSGMHLSLLAHWLSRFLLLWCSPAIAGFLSLFVIAMIASCTTMRDSLMRVLCFRIMTLLFPEHCPQDRLGMAMLLCLLLCPYLAKELTFVLPVCFRLCACFNQRKRHQTLLSFLVLIPIQCAYFHSFDVLAIIFFPFIRILYALIYLCALLLFFLPWDHLLAGSQVLLQCCNLFSTWKWVFYYQASLPFLLLWFWIGLQWLGRNRSKDMKLLALLLLYTQLSPYLRPYLEVMMIDVGQGDCTLISLPFHQGNILIDVAGSEQRDLAEEIIVPVLQAKGITSLDLVILTHDDYDHSGGLGRLMELMDVKQVCKEKQKEPFTFGKFQIQFLLGEETFPDKNENSILTYLQAYDLSFLFMGDAGALCEQALLQTYPNLHADLLKVGHHGSASASTLPFLHHLHPQLGLISCGAHNKYGHPSPNTLSHLEDEHITILDTPSKGAIDIKLTNILRFYKTASGEFGIIKPR